MADGFIQVPPDSTGKKVDNSELTVSAQVVERQRVINADDSDPAGLAKVQAAEPGSTDYGLTVRQVNPHPGDVLSTQSGPMVQGKVDDAPASYVDMELRPISLTRDGRLRVSSVNSDMHQCWQATFDDPWTGAWWPDDQYAFTYRETK